MQSLQISLNKAASILDGIGCNWFLGSGTCLGYLREKKFIPHDDDVDIGIYCKQDEISCIARQLPVKRVLYYKGGITQIKILFSCWVDIFFFMDFHGYIVETLHNERINRIKLLYYEKGILTDGSERGMLENVEVNVLRNSAAYCKNLYGTGFLIPDQKWNWWNDPKNVIWEEFLVEPVLPIK